jgi:uncharacterized protein YfaS (alpha-2-macroglobulin family)
MTSGAQEPLHVLEHMPREATKPVDIITITFDRPVVGTLEHAVDPSRFVRISPEVEMRIEWRDPSTIRIVPLEPLIPGNRYNVTVDTGFGAFDGSRLAAPEHFTLLVRGAALEASVPQLSPTWETALGPTGRVLLAFSAPVSDSMLSDAVKLVTRADKNCGASRTVAYRVERQRPPQKGDSYELGYRPGSPDSVLMRFRRVVEMAPEEPVPENCSADFSVPSLDPLDSYTVLYRMRTPRSFGRVGIGCKGECPIATGVSINFDAPVAPELFMSSVHFYPPTAFSPRAPASATTSWPVPATLAPHSTYRVTIDSTLHDIYGRKMTFGFDTTFTTTERIPDFGYATGLVFTRGDSAPAIRVRHLNVDSIVLLLMPVPESQRVRALLRSPRWYDEHLEPLPDSIVRVIALHAPLNEERTTDIKVPELSGAWTGRLVALQARLYTATRRPDTMPVAPPAARPARTPPPIRVFNQWRETPRTFLEATDLVAHARLSAHGGYVWVTSARSGRPVPGALVSAFDTAGGTIAHATTDEHGMAILALPEAGHPEARVLEVALGADRSLTNLSAPSTPGITWVESLNAVDSWTPRTGTLTHAVVFADRGIYRPGDPVNVGAAIREGALGSLAPPLAGDSARMRMTHYTNEGTIETVHDTIVRSSEFGTIAAGFHLSTEADLGSYTVMVALVRNGGWRDFGGTSLRVGDYRASEFLVTAAGDSAVRSRGDTIVAHVAAKYLFGAPMARAPVYWVARFEQVRPGEVKIPGLGRDWMIGDPGAWWLRSDYGYVSPQQSTDSLDAAGTARFQVRTAGVTGFRPSKVTIEASVSDVNRQMVSATTTSILHPASFYIALRDSSSSTWWQLRPERRVQLMAVGTDGHKIAGVSVRIAIVGYPWKRNVTDDPNDMTGDWHPDTLRVDTLLTRESAQTIALPALHEGPLQIVATALDEKARVVRSTMPRYVFGRGEVPGTSPQLLPLHVKNDHLQPGDSAVVTFMSPWRSADAWVTTEREGVMSERVLNGVRGSVTVKLPITSHDVPNVYVSVLLLRRDSLATAESPAQRMRVGYAVIRVDEASKRLAVQLRALRQEYAPGDSATIELTVRDARRRAVAADATIWGSDEGVLALTGYSVPDPVSRLYAPVGNGVSLSSTLRALPSGIPAWLWRASESGEWRFDHINMLSQVVVTGANAGAIQVSNVAPGSPSTVVPRSLFRTTAFFRNGVRTDANGVARITVKLPDNVTTFRLMAVAVTTGDQYGSGEAPLLVTKPLVVRASLPRFIRASDSVFAGAVINARNRVSRMIDVTASGHGVTLVGDDHAHTSLEGSGTEVRFAWRGVAGDSARFRFDATDGTHSDAVTLSIPVKPDQSPRAHTLTGMVGDSAVVHFRLARNLDPGKSRLMIRTGTSPIPTLLVARDFLLAGSYSCPDQLTSVGRMLVSLLDLERHGAKVLADTTWARNELQHISNEITRRYRSRIIFDCWEMPWEGAPERAAANLLLLDMRDIGIPVDAKVIRGIAAAFTRMLDSVPLFPDTTYGRRADRRMRIADHLQGRLGAIAYLRRTGSNRDADLHALRDNAAHLTWEDRVWLAELLEQTGDHPEARTLLDELWSSLGQAGNRVEIPDSVLTTVGFPSHIRPIARLLGATLLIAPNHPRLGVLVERLTVRTRVERDEWWNTQDHVAATVALSRFARVRRGIAGQLIVRLGADATSGSRPTFTLESGADSPRDTSLSLAGLTTVIGDSTDVAIRLKVGGGAQYYAITVAEITQERPTVPDIKGLVVERWYERFDDGRTVTAVDEGELVRVRLRVTAPASRDFVAVEDVLPAGLETVDLTLRTTGTLGPFMNAGNTATAQRRDREAGGTPNDELYGSWLGGWWSPWGQPEQHDDRTVFFARKLWSGSFTVSYIARATTAGRFVRPQAHAEEVYNPAVNGHSEGGWFDVRPAKP